jgi:hypothetical protein
MIHSARMQYDVVPLDGNRSAQARVQTVSGAIAVALSGLLGGWMLYNALPADGERVAMGLTLVEAPPPATATSRVAAALHQQPALAPPAVLTASVYGALADPTLSRGVAPVSIAQAFPLGSDFALGAPSAPPTAVAAAPSSPVVVAEAEPEAPDMIMSEESAPSGPAEPERILPKQTVPEVVETVPLPAPRPPEQATPEVSDAVPLPAPRPPELRSSANHEPPRASGREFVQQNRTVVAQTPPDNRSFFEKLFGSSQHSGTTLAYASPDDGGPRNSRLTGITPSTGYDRYTAIYDIAAHTVYMPDGTRLEAHSGLGNMIDDPRYVHERNRGATPPHVYDLGVRTELFHGVQALRLSPVGGGDIYGRTGLLAHTYMLGPSGQSNGCVSFRNYNAFLQAFRNGEVKRLAVVARMN